MQCFGSGFKRACGFGWEIEIRIQEGKGIGIKVVQNFRKKLYFLPTDLHLVNKKSKGNVNIDNGSLLLLQNTSLICNRQMLSLKGEGNKK